MLYVVIYDTKVFFQMLQTNNKYIDIHLSYAAKEVKFYLYV